MSSYNHLTGDMRLKFQEEEIMKTKPMTVFLAMLAGWINRQQQEVIEYLKAENSILKEELLKATGKKRIILNDSQRRRQKSIRYAFRKFLYSNMVTFG